MTKVNRKEKRALVLYTQFGMEEPVKKLWLNYRTLEDLLTKVHELTSSTPLVGVKTITDTRELLYMGWDQDLASRCFEANHITPRELADLLRAEYINMLKRETSFSK